MGNFWKILISRNKIKIYGNFSSLLAAIIYWREINFELKKALLKLWTNQLFRWVFLCNFCKNTFANILIFHTSKVRVNQNPFAIRFFRDKKTKVHNGKCLNNICRGKCSVQIAVFSLCFFLLFWIQYVNFREVVSRLRVELAHTWITTRNVWMYLFVVCLVMVNHIFVIDEPSVFQSGFRCA